MSKRLWILPVLAAVLIAAGSGAAFAMPSLGGGTGIVALPNAMVAPMGELQVAGSYQRARGGLEQSLVKALSIYGADESSNAWSVQALAGVATGAELWAAYSRDNSDFENKTWGVGGKFQIPMKGQTGWNVAVGADYKRLKGDVLATALVEVLDLYGNPTGVFDVLTGSLSQTIKDYDVFLAATGDLTTMGKGEWAGGARVLGTVGLMYKKAKREVNFAGVRLPEVSGDDSLFRPYLGVEFLGQDRTGLGLEFRFKDSDLDSKAVFSAVLKHEFEKGFAAELGTTNADVLGFGGDKQNWFARIGYTFATGKY